MKLKIIPGLLILCMVSYALMAQTTKDEDEVVFRFDEVARVDILINQDSLNEILDPDNAESYHEYPATFIFQNSLANDTVENVGFRLRGNTSRFAAKKSFKVSFNSFEGQKFYGLEKMNLNGEHNDPSIIRSRISWELFQNIGLPASRAGYVEFYINNEYRGLYINVEHIDEEFAKRYFGNNDGNLFKCLWPADLQYLGDDPELYKSLGGDRRAYDLRTNEEEDDYSDIAHFIDVLNNTSDEDFAVELEKVLNVTSVIKYFVIEVLASHWDAYSFNKNNYYLYHNLRTGKFEFIPYDMDNTFGIDWFIGDLAERDIYEWSSPWEYRPLYERIMENDEYKDQYSFYMNNILNEYFNETSLHSNIDNIKSLIDPYVEDDPYAPLDYGWSFDDFETSFVDPLGAHVLYGLKPYITERNSSADAQLIINDIFPIYENHTNSFNNETLELIVLANIIDDGSVNVELTYNINDTGESTTSLYDNGSGHDEIANDNIYTNAIGLAYVESGIVQYYITATDDLNQVSRFPKEGYISYYHNQASVKLIINEFMAGNSETIVDNKGEFEDWIEIHNADDLPAFLGDKYITDDLTKPDKWRMPAITLQPGDFTLIWADSDTEQGSNHASFKLSKSGEEIGIYEPNGSNFNEITSIIYGEQDDNISSGTSVEGEQQYEQLQTVTPNYSNSDDSQGTVTLNVNMSYQQKLGNFSAEEDFVDVAGTFNDWDGSGTMFDSNEDYIYAYTLFNVPVNEFLSYKFRINADWGTSEFPDGGPNREYTVQVGLNKLTHWYNDEIDPDAIVNQLLNESKLIIWPNPVKDVIFIKSNLPIKTVFVYDIVGKIVLSEYNFDDSKYLNVADLNSGIYSVKVIFGDNKFNSTKIIKF